MGANPCSSVSQGGQSVVLMYPVVISKKSAALGYICAAGITDLTQYGHIWWEYCVPSITFP